MGAPVTDLVADIDTPVGKARAALARHLAEHDEAVPADVLAVYTVVLLAHGERVTAVDVHDARCVALLGRVRTAGRVVPYSDTNVDEQRHAATVAEAIAAAVRELEALEPGDLVTDSGALARLRTGAVLSNGTTAAVRVNHDEPAWSVTGYERDLTTADVAAAVLPATLLTLGGTP